MVQTRIERVFRSVHHNGVPERREELIYIRAAAIRYRILKDFDSFEISPARLLSHGISETLASS